MARRSPVTIPWPLSTAPGASPQEAGGRLIRHDLEMIGLAANDAAKSHEPVIAGCCRILARIVSHGDGGRDLQGARHGDDVEIYARRAQGILGPVQQGVGQFVVIARLDDQDAVGIS